MAKKNIAAADVNAAIEALMRAAELLKVTQMQAPEKASEKAPAKTSKKAENKGKPNVKDFEPVKNAEGFYVWSSYKAKRRAFVEASTGLVLHGKNGKWLAGDDFKKAAKPFEAAFKYVKVSER